MTLSDAGLVGLACSDPQNPDVKALNLNLWLDSMSGLDVDVDIPDVTRFEVRRELARIGASAMLRRLDRLRDNLGTLPVTLEVWEWAGEFSAIVRQKGRPTAHPQTLDADAILAANKLIPRSPLMVVTKFSFRHRYSYSWL